MIKEFPFAQGVRMKGGVAYFEEDGGFAAIVHTWDNAKLLPTIKKRRFWRFALGSCPTPEAARGVVGILTALAALTLLGGVAIGASWPETESGPYAVGFRIETR